MDAYETCELVLSQIRTSNLNFSIKESPFSALISLRKTFIRNKIGEKLFYRGENSDPDHLGISAQLKTLREENEFLKDELDKTKCSETEFKTIAHELGLKLEKSKVEISELWVQNNLKEKALEDCDEKLHRGQEKVSALKVGNEKLKSDLAAAAFHSNSLEETLNGKDIDNLNIIGENTDLKNYGTRLEKQLDQKCVELEKIGKKLLNMEKQLDKAASEIKDLKNIKNDMKVKLTKSKAELDATKEKLEDKIQEIEVLIDAGNNNNVKGDEIAPVIFNPPNQEQSITPCSHIPQCSLRQPNNPPPSPPSNPLRPPSSIRLLPREVSSYKEFCELGTIHKCEECDEEGSLYFNYYEMVSYPDPGPCGGTSGSPVSTCPNDTNASISFNIISSENKSKFRKWTFKCKICGDHFTKKANLRFHKKRKHDMNIPN